MASARHRRNEERTKNLLKSDEIWQLQEISVV